MSAHHWHPFRPLCIDYREVEHVYHTAVQQSGIAFAEFSHTKVTYIIIYGRVKCQTTIKHESVEHTVDQVACCTRQDHGRAYFYTIAQSALHQGLYPIEPEAYCYQTEEGKDYLSSGRIHDLHPEGHSGILDKVQLEPFLAHDVDTVTIIEIKLNVYLDELVYEDNQEDEE
ncbi:hypothetical protein D3C80_1587310 [compost metagenome]